MAGDTIFALASGGTPAGVAVIRVSGPGVRFGLETLIDSIPEPRRASLRIILNVSGEPADRGLVLFFPGPASFTGEDVAEFHLHGGRAVVAAVLDSLSALPGYRAAEAGEFTRRAFESGRLDLSQVEGLADLVAAETEAQRRQALQQAGGRLREACEGWRERLVRARALLEAELDFPDEEDVPGSVSESAWADVAAVSAEIGEALADSRRGERVRDGFEVVVLGAPNAGKSSLINALAERDVAIVSEEPGTTRDVIEVRLDLGGYPVTVVDTAGLREAGGAIEREGMRRAALRAEAADLVLWLEDMAGPLTVEKVPEGVRTIWVGTKLDRVDSEEERSSRANRYEIVTSLASGQGLDLLVGRVAELAREALGGRGSSLVTRSRQRSALTWCRSALDEALVGSDRPLELRAEDLRRATDALARVTGRVDVEEMLDVIFREFCIGK
ncbi:MAG: tRNA uridine-5-carboxymethylaminomethyl(34) synthesis GTPase MnmE [Bauldia sp.]|nr:tRNA uridine-5-carboxymethylaminomethyl(34) synthesis GTPase MnmE [Bauldia sp.]